MEDWKIGRLEDWKIGRLEDWKIGRLEDWKIGRLENWKIGKLENWKIGRLEDWKIVDSENMGKIERFEDLEVWQEAIKVGVKVYRLSETGKLKRDFSAKDQLKRACISISNNIAEGFEYNSNPSFQRFLTYAKGSAGELRSELFFLKAAEVISKEEYESLVPDLLKVSKSISGFKKYLREFESKKKPKSSNH